MFVLSSTGQSLVGVLGGAATATQPAFMVSYGDATDSSFTEGGNHGAFNDMSEVTLAAAPAADTRRVVKNITIYNADSAAITVTVSLADGATRRPLFRILLAAGKSWDYLRAGDGADHQGIDPDDAPEFAGLYLSDGIEFTDDDNAVLAYQRSGPSGTPTMDGWRWRYAEDFFGAAHDALIWEKCDGNGADPDGGFAWTMTGNDGVESLAFAVLAGYVRIHGGYLRWNTDHFEYSSNGTDWSEIGSGGGGGGAENIVRNAVFNARARGLSALPDWYEADHVSSAATIAYDTPPAGYGSSKCLKITANEDDSGVKITVKPKAGTTYTLHALVKTDSGDNFQGSTTGGSSNAALTHSGTSWTIVSDQFTTDGTPTDVVIHLQAVANGDVVYIAAVWVTETAGAVPFSPGLGWVDIEVDAGDFFYPTANPAGLGAVIGTYIRENLQLFDDTTPELVLRDTDIPANIDAGSSVIFIARGRAITAAASRYVQLQFGHSCITDGGAQDTAYSTVDSADHLCNATQGQLDSVVWQSPVSTLGWAGGDALHYYISRIATVLTNLTGDWGLRKFILRIPVRG